MKHTLSACLLPLGLTLAGCAVDPTTGAVDLTTPAPITAATLRADIAEGQLICSAGPSTVAMFSTTGAAILAKGAPKAVVDTVCGLIGSVAVSPAGAPVGSVSVTLPPSLTVPLKS